LKTHPLSTEPIDCTPATLVTPHIWTDLEGHAWIDSTEIKVDEVVHDYRVHGWSPEAMHNQFPLLSLAQIHAALAYYLDHQEDIEQQMEASLREAEKLAPPTYTFPLRRWLREQRKLD
jgi:uncharacterized protein (DUF433 family)